MGRTIELSLDLTRDELADLHRAIDCALEEFGYSRELSAGWRELHGRLPPQEGCSQEWFRE